VAGSGGSSCQQELLVQELLLLADEGQPCTKRAASADLVAPDLPSAES
jgi:hypothetical protein